MFSAFQLPTPRANIFFLLTDEGNSWVGNDSTQVEGYTGAVVRIPGAHMINDTLFPPPYITVENSLFYLSIPVPRHKSGDILQKLQRAVTKSKMLSLRRLQY